MANKTFNNQSSWRTALDELTLPQDQPMHDTNILWGRLEERIIKKRTSRPWYWLAAACLCITGVFIISNNKNPASTITIQHNTHSDVTKAIHASSLKMVSATTPVIEKNNIRSSVFKKITLVHSDRSAPVKIPPATTVIQTQDSMISPLLLTHAPKTKGIFYNTLNKKLPIVHINDMEEPVDEMPAVAEKNNRPFLSIRLFNRENLPASPANNGANDFLKIKLNPPN